MVRSPPGRLKVTAMIEQWAPWVAGFIVFYFTMTVITEVAKQIIITREYKKRLALWLESGLPTEQMPKE